MMNRFQTRLLLLFLPLLLAVQGITIALVYSTTRDHIAEQSHKALVATSNNFEHWLDETAARLADSSLILAADFGFRSAIASRDTLTIRSALENASARINADEIMLIGLIGDILTAPMTASVEQTPFPNSDLLERARTNGQAAALIEFGGKVLQFVVIPVLAPDVIAWIGIGVEVNDAEAARLKQQSTIPVDLTFAYAKHGKRWNPVATTLMENRVKALPGALAGLLAEREPASTKTNPQNLDMDGETYATSIELLNRGESGYQVGAIIQYSLNAALDPHRPLFVFLIVPALTGFVVTAFAAVALARGITRPIHALDQAARRIRSGDYANDIVVSGPEEIDRLADTFNEMVAGIAEREKHIEHQATHDELTGLPNRQFLERLIAEEIDELDGRSGFALVAINLESFTEIDNTLGHELGDKLLGDAARRITNTLKETDTNCRFARDKFVIFTRDAVDSTIELIVGRIHLAFEAPYSVSDINIDVGVQIGVAKYPEHGDDHRTLLRHMEIAAESARDRFEAFSIYDPAADRYTAERLALMSDLREGLDREELELHYQPKIDLQTGGIVQAEALMRWHHPRRGNVPPDEFIGLAERTGFIRRLTRWALTRAIEDCRDWRKQGFPITICVNVSAKDLLDPALPSFIVHELTRCKLDTDAIVLEITENAVMERPDLTIELLKALSAMGLQISIDDFGTGLSSMAYLKQLPAKELKIDKSFVTELATNRDDQVVVKTAIRLGRDLGMKVTAEGIEDAPSAEYLKVHGCDLGQGWFFARAMQKTAFTELLGEWNGRLEEPPSANVANLRP